MMGMPTSAVANGPVSGLATIAGPGLIAIEEQTVRLWGVLMPGRSTAEGEIAYGQFGRLIEGRRLTCVPTDQSDAPVSDAICRTQDGTDIAELLVREGWALDDGPRSRGHYLNEMEEAAARRRGVWGLAGSNEVVVLAEAERPPIAATNEPLAANENPSQPDNEATAGRAPEIPADGGSTNGEDADGAQDAGPEEEVPVALGDAAQAAAAPIAAVEAPAGRPSLGRALQVASGASTAQRAAELARMRASYGWLFENRSVRLVDPTVPGARYRAVIQVPEPQIADVCARLSQAREACLLIRQF